MGRMGGDGGQGGEPQVGELRAGKWGVEVDAGID